jgi:glycosyltransferase involved in cell wall biosynthesis
VRIGFDVTALYVAQAGVFYYDYNLLRALLAHDRENEYLLLDYCPIHGGVSDPPERVRLNAPNANVVHCAGLRNRRLSRWWLMQRPILQPVAALIDRTLLWPWAKTAETVMHRRLVEVLDSMDVFHSSEVLLWRQPGALNVVTIYDMTALLFPEHHTAGTRELQIRKFRFAQEKADAVIAISEATKRDIVAHLGISAQRVHVIYGGVSPAFHPIEARNALARALAPMGLSPGSYILYVGTIEPRKNLRRLIEAYHLLRKMMPPPAPKLVLAGASGWKYQETFECVEDLNLEGAVVFLGRVSSEALPALYNGAVLFIYPSLYEGLGLPPLEAMACGVPVIASNVSSLPEIVGDAGILIDPQDVQALAAILKNLLEDGERRTELREAGLARASQFSWERAAREMLELYKSTGN